MADSHLTRRFEVVVHYDLNMNEILKMSMAKVSGGFLCREFERYPCLMVIAQQEKNNTQRNFVHSRRVKMTHIQIHRGTEKC